MTTRRNTLLALARLVVGVIFVWAGISKAIAPSSFAKVAAFFMPDSIQTPTGLVVAVALLASIETGVGLAVLFVATRAVIRMTVLVLAAFSCALIVLAVSPVAPACGCLSPVGIDGRTGGALAGLARNAALIWMAVWLLRSPWHKPDGEHAMSDSSPAGPQAALRGFSLIEILVVIVILAILVSIALPALAGMRESSRAARRATTTRELHTALMVYCADFRDAFPYFATRGDPWGPVVIKGFQLPGKGQYFNGQVKYWASVIVPDYYRAARSSIEPQSTPAYLTANGFPEFIVRSFVFPTATMFASSPYWREGGTGWGEDLAYLQPTRVSDIVNPDRKGILMHLHYPWAMEKWPSGNVVSMGDGSVRLIQKHEFDHRLSVWRDLVTGVGQGSVMTTRDGLAGIDFR